MSELSRETRDLLARGRPGRALAPAHRARLKRALLAEVAVASIVTTTTTAAAWTSVAAKIAGVVALVAVAGTGVAVMARRSEPPPPAPTSARVTAAKATDIPAPPPPAVPAAELAVAPPATVAAHPSQPAPSLPAPGSLAASPAPSATAAMPALLPTTPSTSTSTSTSTSNSNSTSTSTSTPSSSLEEEARLLRDADGALKAGDNEGALRILAEHARRFPQGALEPERSAERVFALCQAGRMDEARADADTFLKAHPPGPLATRVRSSCGGR